MRSFQTSSGRANTSLSLVCSLALVAMFGNLLGFSLVGDGREGMPVVSLRPVLGVDTLYAGKYATDPAFQEAVRELRLMRAAALQQASLATGLPVGDADRFVVRFKDWPDFGASSRPARSQDGDVLLVTLSAEQVMLGVMDLRGSMVHEFIHGLMREALGDRYAKLPRWFREGVAVWGSGQLMERLHDAVARAFIEGRSALELRLQLSEPDDEYLHPALLFEFLSAGRGPGQVARLLGLLRDGESLEAAFETVSGLSWLEFRAEAGRYEREFLERFVAASGLDEFRAAQELQEAGDREGSNRRLAALLAAHPGSILAPHAWFEMGRNCFELGRYPESAEAYATLLSQYPGQLGLRGEALLGLARAHLAGGELGEALVELKWFLRENPRARREQRGEAQRLLGTLYFLTEDYLSAAHHLRSAVQVGCRDPQEAYALLALAHRNAGETLQALQAAAELRSHFPNSTYLQ